MNPRWWQGKSWGPERPERLDSPVGASGRDWTRGRRTAVQRGRDSFLLWASEPPMYNIQGTGLSGLELRLPGFADNYELSASFVSRT